MDIFTNHVPVFHPTNFSRTSYSPPLFLPHAPSKYFTNDKPEPMEGSPIRCHGVVGLTGGESYNYLLPPSPLKTPIKKNWVQIISAFSPTSCVS